LQRTAVAPRRLFSLAAMALIVRQPYYLDVTPPTLHAALLAVAAPASREKPVARRRRGVPLAGVSAV